LLFYTLFISEINPSKEGFQAKEYWTEVCIKKVVEVAGYIHFTCSEGLTFVKGRRTLLLKRAAMPRR